MPELAFLVAGALTARSGGSIYNRRMVESLRDKGWAVAVHELDSSFPCPTAEALQHASSVLHQLSSATTVLVDGLAFGAMPEVIAQASPRLLFVPIIHLPLAAAIGLTPEMTARMADLERRALSCADRVIVTGPETRSLMKAHGLANEEVIVVEPGTDPAPLARGSGSSDVHVLCVAALTPGKGHVTLIESFAALPHRRWRLVCAGSLSRCPQETDRVRRALASHDLVAQVSLPGELGAEELEDAYHHADVAVLATLRETFGMAVAEALARGLPVVATTTGAIPALVGRDAGLLVAPGDRASLTSALQRIIDDADLRARCAAGARRVRERLPDWNDAAARLIAALPS